MKNSIDHINLNGINESKLKMVKKLNVSLYSDNPYSKDSIMKYGKICQCDSGFLCEHRLQEIVNFLKAN